MAPRFCSRHPHAAAAYRCEGCAAMLCDDCVEEGHALLFCGACGERALPLGRQPATVAERRQAIVRERPYSLRQALAYPFRGSGIYLVVVTLAIFGFLWFLGNMPNVFGCLAVIVVTLLSLGFSLLLAAFQLRIVRSTVDGDDELPDWPDVGLGSLFLDFLIWIFIVALQFLFVVPWLLVSGLENLASREPGPLFWLVTAACLWLGTATSILALGAAGNYRRARAFSLLRHVQAFVAAGADAVKVTNLVFALGAVVLALRFWLELRVPWIGLGISSILGTYWMFTTPHLAGVLFRRHASRMDEIY